MDTSNDHHRRPRGCQDSRVLNMEALVSILFREPVDNTPLNNIMGARTILGMILEETEVQ